MRAVSGLLLVSKIIHIHRLSQNTKLCRLSLVMDLLEHHLFSLQTNIFSERIFHLKIGKSRKKSFRGFPGGAVVESLPAGAGDMGSSPGLGGTHMPRSGWAREPQLLSLRVWSLCSATGEAAMVRDPRTVMRGGPRLPRLGKAFAQRQGPNTAIK